MKFIYPCIEYEQQAKIYIQEFLDYSSEINGTGALDWFVENSTYLDWLIKVKADSDIANISEGRVPAFTYFYVDDKNTIIGMINIRLALNDFLRKEGGHIGYSIRPHERGKGYGTRMFREALVFCERIITGGIILSCGKKNTASASIIKKCGGVLTDEFYSETFKEVIQKYLIKNKSNYLH